MKHFNIKSMMILALALIITYVTLLIVDTIQKQQRSDGDTNPVTIEENTGEIRSYNVDGLSDEEINKVIEEGRSKGEE